MFRFTSQCSASVAKQSGMSTIFSHCLHKVGCHGWCLDSQFVNSFLLWTNTTCHCQTSPLWESPHHHCTQATDQVSWQPSVWNQAIETFVVSSWWPKHKGWWVLRCDSLHWWWRYFPDSLQWYSQTMQGPSHLEVHNASSIEDKLNIGWYEHQDQ